MGRCGPSDVEAAVRTQAMSVFARERARCDLGPTDCCQEWRVHCSSGGSESRARRSMARCPPPSNPICRTTDEEVWNERQDQSDDDRLARIKPPQDEQLKDRVQDDCGDQ